MGGHGMETEMGTVKEEAVMEMVWGRRRAPPPPEDDDEVERSRSAKAKNDPLSVYEATLLKLRHGSVQAFAAALPVPDDAANGGGGNGAASAQIKQTD